MVATFVNLQRERATCLANSLTNEHTPSDGIQCDLHTGLVHHSLVRAVLESDCLLGLGWGHGEHAMHILQAVANVTDRVASTLLQRKGLGEGAIHNSFVN